MSATDPAARTLQHLAARWSQHEARAAEVVRGACEALVAGLDGEGLRELAALSRAEADYGVPELLPRALGELGLVHYPLDSEEGRGAGVRAMAQALLAGELTPRELAFRIHQRYGHSVPLAERLAELDDEYDTLEYSARTAPELDADVVTEARRLVG
jgi:hypothetical protein